jgi:uncharacterized surface protein with fasciclin (FAS1) repeats
VRNVRGVAGIGITAAAVLALAACGSSDTASTSPSSSAPAPAPMTSSSAPAGNSASSGDGVTTAADVAGPACKLVPTSGEGSVGGMIDDPVATAASNNPLLTKLVAAVTAANLGDTLNSQPAITVFAPDDDAFNALGADAFASLAKDPTKLTPILKYHVVGQRYDLKGLMAAGSVPTLDADGGNLKIGGTADAPTVNGDPILCWNVPTKNATVFVVGKVLTPGTNKS